MKIKNFINYDDLKKYCYADEHHETSWIDKLDHEIVHTPEDHDKMPEFRDTADELKKLRKNYSGFFARITEITIISTMIVLTIFNTFYVPNHLRDTQIPLIFRDNDTN